MKYYKLLGPKEGDSTVVFFGRDDDGTPLGGGAGQVVGLTAEQKQRLEEVWYLEDSSKSEAEEQEEALVPGVSGGLVAPGSQIAPAGGDDDKSKDK